MVSAKAVAPLLLLLAFVCGCFFAGARSGLFFSAGIDRTATRTAPEGIGFLLASLPDATTAELPQSSSITSGPSDATVSVAVQGASVNARVVVFGADEVLLYLDGGVLSASLYLGKASYEGDGIWSYEFDLDERPLPNGAYRIYAQITRNNSIFKSGPADLVIDARIESDPAQKIAIEKTIQESNLAIEVNEQAISRAIKTAAGSINLKSAPTNANENILEIANTVKTIEQLNRDQTEAVLGRQAANESIRRLGDEIASLAENTLASIRSEKIKELDELKSRVRQLDQDISDIQERIGEKESSLEAAKAAILDQVPEGEKATISRILEELENEVSGQEKDTIAKRLILARDSDNDGASDAQEILAGTDPANPDSDSDGALDGDEMARGYNPLVAGNFTNIDYEDPRAVAPRKTDIYKVARISSVASKDNEAAIRLEGNGLPNSYVVVFIYSVPIVAVVKADSSGAWSYDLDQLLSDGRHTAYAALVDSAGKIVARSEQFVFTKSGDSVVQNLYDEETAPSSTADDLKNTFGIYLAFIIIISLAIALLAIGFITRNHPGDTAER